MRSFANVFQKKLLTQQPNLFRMFSTPASNRLLKLFQNIGRNPEAWTEDAVRAEIRKLPRERLNLPAASLRASTHDMIASNWVTQIDNEQQLGDAINAARQEKQKIRVTGSGHSAPPSISPDANTHSLVNLRQACVTTPTANH